MIEFKEFPIFIGKNGEFLTGSRKDKMKIINQIIQGDCLTILKMLPDESINCCITSPPYWRLRDYGVAKQLGLEKTPEEYVAKLVEIFREVRRVLKNDGTLWLNLGDSYACGGRGCDTLKQKSNKGTDRMPKSIVPIGLKPKDLVGIPWLVAFSLRADGWYLRQDIIWSKTNPMPESVRDRLSKKAKYYYDADIIAEKTITKADSNRERNNSKLNNTPGRTIMGGLKTNNYETRNRRSVWTVTTIPFKGAHFATFPETLIEPMVLAGCPEGEIILDPFMGAGTTAVVTKKNYRNYIGIELNPKYIEIANKRIAETLINKKLEFKK